MVGSPIQPSASDAIVIPSWVAEMKSVGLLIKRNAACARRLPPAARASRRVRRTDTSANSAPTKNPFAPTNNKTAANFVRNLTRITENWVSPARRPRKLLAGSSIANRREQLCVHHNTTQKRRAVRNVAPRAQGILNFEEISVRLLPRLLRDEQRRSLFLRAVRKPAPAHHSRVARCCTQAGGKQRQVRKRQGSAPVPACAVHEKKGVCCDSGN